MNWLRRIMTGRYGVDQLSRTMLILSLVLLVINSFIGSKIINSMTMIILILSYLRIFSTNVSKRYQENIRFLQRWNPIKYRIERYISHLKEYKTYRFYKCPQCGQELRVPKGKGKIRITCPKCQNAIIKRT